MAKKKGLLEIVLMPLVVAVVGALATYFVTKQQIRSTEGEKGEKGVGPS